MKTLALQELTAYPVLSRLGRHGCLLLLCFACLPLHAQFSEFLKFDNYSTKDGLASNLVNDIIRDSMGFVWTYGNGISCFDGLAFKTYPFPFFGYDRNNLAVDAKGHLWATEGLYLYRYHRGRDTFERVSMRDTTRAGLAFIHSNFPDKETWFRKGEDLYRIDPQQGIPVLKKTELPLAAEHFNYRDQYGRFWFSYTSQVYCYIPEKDTLAVFPFEGMAPHRFLGEGEDKIWISSNGEGLFLLNMKNQNREAFKQPQVQNAYFDLTLFPALTGDSVIWINGKIYEGIQRFSKRQKKFVGGFLHDKLNPQSLSDNITYKLYLDHEGILWAGTAGGISMAHPRRQDIVRYILPIDHKGLSQNAIDGGIGYSVDDPIIFFDRNRLLYFYEGTARKIKQSGPLGLGLNQNASIWGCYDGNGKLWISTATGLHQIDRQRSTVRQSYIIDAKGGAIITELVSDRQNNLWFTLDRNLAKWDPKSRKMDVFRPVLGDTNAFHPDDAPIEKIFDDKGHLWITMLRDVVHFNPVSGSVLRRYTFPKLPKFNGRPYEIRDMELDGKGNFWLSLHSGLVKVDSFSGEFQLIYLPGIDSTAASHVNNSVIDRKGHIWLATYAGVYCYLPEQGRFVHFDEKNDLSSNIVDRIGWVGERLYAYHADGTMDIIDPELALQPLPVPPVYMTGFKILDRQIQCDWDSLAVHPLRLSYLDNILTFQYAAVDFAAPKKVTYQYRLDGFDDAWRDGGARREATYTNLGGGYYTFRVRAINGDGIASSNHAVMRIYIRPPFWATWWFRTLLFLAFIALTYAIFRYRELQRLQQEKLRLSIARDLHDEVGSTLSSISILSEAAMRHLQEDIDRARFGIIGNRARQVMEAMSDIVWSVNPRNDSMEHILQRMKEFAVELFESQGITLHFQTDEAVKTLNLPMEQRKDFYLLFKEAANNAAKYSGASEVRVLIKKDNTNIRLEIHDNGKGFDPASIKKGNGLWNMQRRAERMGGELVLESKVGEGTRIQLIVG